MRTWSVVAAVVLVGAGSGCARNKAEAPAAPAPTASAAGAPATVRRAPQPPNWERQDSVRRALVAQVLGTIAGRENEPAGKVFKNVQLNKNMPAIEFLAMMNEQYGRSIGASCTGCHTNSNVAGVLNVNWADDEPKKKQISRQMERMTQSINKDLAKVKELDQPFPKATCVMCHRGAEHMPNTMEPLKNSETPPTRKRG